MTRLAPSSSTHRHRRHAAILRRARRASHLAALARAALAARGTAALALALHAALACAPDERDREPATRAATPAVRRIADVPRALWTVAPDGDSALAEPSAIRVAAGQVMVAELAAHRVRALDLRTGAERWRTGAGTGRDVPGGLVEPIALAVTPSGAIAVADAGARRIHLLAPDGTPAGLVAPATEGTPRHLCATSDGGFVLGSADPRGRLVVVDRDGARPVTIGWPWRDADSLDDLRLQAVLASSDDGARCVAALKLGRGFLVLTPPRAMRPPDVAVGTYVEPMVLPALQVAESGAGASYRRLASIGDAPLAARDVAVIGDAVAIAFQGTTPDRARLVDLHALADGAYRGTLRIPVQAHGIAGAGDTLVILHRARGRWAVTAFHAPGLRTGVAAGARASAPAAADAAPRSRG